MRLSVELSKTLLDAQGFRRLQTGAPGGEARRFLVIVEFNSYGYSMLDWSKCPG